MPRDQFAVRHQLRVRWAEVDMQKVVFNGHYLTYIDTAVGEHWRALGIGYPEGYVDRFGCDVFLRKSTLDYLGPARFDELLDVYVRVARLGRTSLTYALELHRAEPAPQAGAERPLLTAELVYVNVEVKTMAPVALPEELRARIVALELVAPG